MSNRHNDAFLESCQSEFGGTPNGKRRGLIVKELKEGGFPHLSDRLVEDWYQERKDFLAKHSVTEKDVIRDDLGIEYFISLNESGNPGEEGYAFHKLRVMMPEYLDVAFFLGKYS